MKARAEYLGKWELGVLILCGAFVLVTIGAVGESGRGRAKEAVCQANLHQWGRYFQDYIEQNDGKFFSGCNDQGYWWPLQLPQELQDWRKNRTWFCPVATRPVFDGPGAPVSLRKDSAWGIYDSPTHYTYKGKTYTMNPNGLAGSFGLNGYLLDIPDRSQYEGAMPAAYGWRDLPHVANADTVPMSLDALRFDLWPNHVDAPASSEMGQLAGARMTQCCVNRHDGAVNCLFVDGSVRKVGLKELWTLKWHRTFHTTGMWTKAGGVLPYDWPPWMRPFKEY